MSFYELGKRVTIDRPGQIPLSPNEKKLYGLLKEGKSPQECAAVMHKRFGGECELGAHNYGAPIETIYNMIISIRQKGYEIPDTVEKPKEDTVAELTENRKRAIVQAVSNGGKVGDTAARYGVDKQTVHSLVKEWNEHGEAAFGSVSSGAAAGSGDNGDGAEDNAADTPSEGGKGKTRRYRTAAEMAEAKARAREMLINGGTYREVKAVCGLTDTQICKLKKELVGARAETVKESDGAVPVRVTAENTADASETAAAAEGPAGEQLRGKSRGKKSETRELNAKVREMLMTDGYSFREIAEACGTNKSRVYRIKEKMKAEQAKANCSGVPEPSGVPVTSDPAELAAAECVIRQVKHLSARIADMEQAMVEAETERKLLREWLEKRGIGGGDVE